jgi:glyoxylase-like metal-dependent hydrolase (beta-lactamase superfamily II)
MIEHLIVGALATNCYIVPLRENESGPPRPSPAAVIDPGADAAVIISRLERRKLYPEYILLTHGHFDHIAALPSLYKHYADIKPVIAIGKDDAGYIGNNSLSIHQKSFKAAVGNSDYIDALWEEMPDANILLEEGSVIGPFSVLHLPGHSEGSVAFYDEKIKTLFAGDTLFKRGMGRTDLPGGDGDKLNASLARLFTLDDDIRVYSGHGDSTTIGAEASFFFNY